MVIQSGNFTALISPQGGSILQAYWKDRMFLGTPKLVQKADGTTGWRGVSHWCWPYWGPAPDNPALPKHGTLRDTEMVRSPKVSTEGEFVLLSHDRSLEVTTRVWGSVKTALSCRENPKTTQVLAAHHPYFPISSKGAEIMVGGKIIQSKIDNNFSTGVLLKRGNYPIQVHLKGVGWVQIIALCTHVKVWSDNPHEYVCVEPIFGDPTAHQNGKGEVLGKGARDTWDVEFIFDPD